MPFALSGPLRALATGLFALLLGCQHRAEASALAAKQAQPNPTGFAVLELFTSEGCSSCPPADAVLSALAGEASRDGTRVFPLSFHVDYWNNLGWADPHSSAQFTQRQWSYAHARGTTSVYTPQMIVNGTDELVGSRGSQARDAVARALAEPAKATIQLRVTREASAVRVGFDVQGAPRGAVLNLAVVQPSFVSHVTRGENAGRTLPHVNVVRSFESVVLGDSPSGEQRLALPNDARGAGWFVIGYAQQPEQGAVLGVTTATF